MPHAFDTALEVPQRTLIRQAVVQRLSALKAPLYAKCVKGLAFEPETVEDLAQEVAGQTPAILVYLGRKSFQPRAVSADRARWRAELELQVFVVVDQLRSQISRVESDAVATADLTKDPGLDTILEHVEELLSGFSPDPDDSEETVYQAGLEYEAESFHGPEGTMWLQVYSIGVVRDFDTTKGISQLVEEILTTHHQDDSPEENDVEALTVLTEEP